MIRQRVTRTERVNSIQLLSNNDTNDCLPYTNAQKKKTLNFMAPFYGWGSTASRLQPLRGGSLLFTIQFPGISGTHFIDLRRMKG